MKTDRQIREKLIVSGADRLSDAELLAIIIREGMENLSAVELAEKILADFSVAEANYDTGRSQNAGRNSDRNTNPNSGTDPSSETGAPEKRCSDKARGSDGALSGLASAGVQRIRRAAGCGTMRAVSIAAAVELARRLAAEKTLAVSTITSKEDVVKLFAPLAELGHEEFWVLYLTSGGRIIDRARLSQGGVAGTVVDHKLVVKRAVELLASSLILVHNHPSGIAKPSPEDGRITETVSAAAALFDINVIDHIIVSRSGSYSFAENGGMPPKRP